MSAPTHNGHRPEQVHKHSAPVPKRARIQRTLDMLLAVVTIDTLINLGVLVAGMVVMFIELGWMHGAH